MRYIIISTFMLLSLNLCIAQSVYTKDDVLIGDKQDFMIGCVNAMDDEIVNIDGIEINTKEYCSCICDKIIPNLYSSEIENAADEEKMADLFLRDDNLELLIECAGSTIEIGGDYKFEKGEFDGVIYDAGVKKCVDELMNDPETAELFTQSIAEEYCSCAMGKVLSNGYTYEELMEADDENGVTFNEIAIPCFNEVIGNQATTTSANKYTPLDVLGYSRSSRVQLIDYLNIGFKIEINIDGITKYYLFDTGASDLIIDRDMERELLLNGTLKRESYLEKEYYTMANNEVVEAQLVRLNNVRIGDYTVNNVIVAIIDEGSFLCGVGFFDKFQKWEFDQEIGVLTLFK